MSICIQSICVQVLKVNFLPYFHVAFQGLEAGLRCLWMAFQAVGPNDRKLRLPKNTWKGLGTVRFEWYLVWASSLSI